MVKSQVRPRNPSRNSVWDTWWYYRSEEEFPLDNSKTNCYERGVVILREQRYAKWISTMVVSRVDGGTLSLSNRRIVCFYCSTVRCKITSCLRAEKRGFYTSPSYLQNIRDMCHVELIYARKKEGDYQMSQ
jgi:hypothetical protein